MSCIGLILVRENYKTIAMQQYNDFLHSVVLSEQDVKRGLSNS